MIRLLHLFRRTALGRKLQPILFVAGEVYRKVMIRYFPNMTVEKKLSSYGPYRISAKFLFSDFSNWSTYHNAGFDQLIEESKNKSCVFDIGGHIGLTALPLATNVQAGSRVYVFEPGNSNLYYLKKHISVNNIDNVTIVESLVGDAVKSEVSFFQNEDVSGAHSIANIRKEFTETTVDMVSIDSFCEKIGAIPDLIKIDVEGAEFMVLSGGRRILECHAPVVFLSVHPRQLSSLGINCDELSQLIRKLGYDVWDVGRRKKKIETLDFGEYHLEKSSKRWYS